MHPSNYSRPGRKWKCIQGDSQSTNNAHNKPPLQKSTVSFGPNLVINETSAPSLRFSYPDNSNIKMSESTITNVQDTGSLANEQPNDINNPQKLPQSVELNKEPGQNCINHTSVRRRSGSWTGVNESDDDMAYISRNNAQPSSRMEQSRSFDDSLTSSSIPDISIYGNSYQNNYNSNSSDNTVPPNCHCTNEETIKRRLKFFFMNPIEKWHAKKRLPWKLLIQIVKIIICTAQLCMFASQRYNHVTYLWDTKITFSHLFLKDWDTSREITAYPPATGPLAIYEIENFYEFMDFSIKAFSTVNATAIGAYKYDKKNETIVMPVFCFAEYGRETSSQDNETFVFNSTIHQVCVDIPPSIFNLTTKWSTKEFLASRNMSIDFEVLVDASFAFNLKILKLQSDFPFESPECYKLESLIIYDNSDHDGQMLVDLDIGAKVLDCEETVNTMTTSDKTYMDSFRSILNMLTILICFISFCMCCRTLYRANILKKVVNNYFRVRFCRDLNTWEKFEFVNLWYALICINDLLIIIGSIIKMSLESQDYEGYLDKWNACSLLLGTGNLLIWFGCLRYLGFFKTYNVLILTIKRCFPNVLRYSICILMVFAGYSFCGWLVLGPYHLKFRSLSSTTECLYSLINGDDMFATFSSTIGKDMIVWWFSRIYLYTFISLFIYVILSLFIAIITDAYDTIKRYYEEGFPQSQLMSFANECQSDPWSGVFHDDETTIQDIINHICCCCPGFRSHSLVGYEAIST